MTLVSGSNPDIVVRLLGQPVVHCFAIDYDKLTPFSMADGLSSRPRFLLRVDFQDAKSVSNIMVARVMNLERDHDLTNKTISNSTALIIPGSLSSNNSSPEVDNSAILTAATIIWFP